MSKIRYFTVTDTQEFLEMVARDPKETFKLTWRPTSADAEFWRIKNGDANNYSWGGIAIDLPMDWGAVLFDNWSKNQWGEAIRYKTLSAICKILGEAGILEEGWKEQLKTALAAKKAREEAAERQRYINRLSYDLQSMLVERGPGEGKFRPDEATKEAQNLSETSGGSFHVVFQPKDGPGFIVTSVEQFMIAVGLQEAENG